MSENLGPITDLAKESPEVQKAAHEIEKAMEQVPPHRRKKFLNKLRRTTDKQFKDLLEERAFTQKHHDALTNLLDWIESNPKGNLEKNDCSRLHHLKQAAKEGRLEGKDDDGGITKLFPPEEFSQLKHTFVVKHDWARAFEHAEGIEDLIKLPYELCAFEFRTDGRSIIAVAVEAGTEIKFGCFAQADLWWESLGGSGMKEHPVIGSIWKQMRAICIALDAELATSTVIRAPHKLNQKREREGKLPLEDYHIVDLSRRHRVANPSGGHTGTKVRLHFRRGHWRHFETTKTWVRWCMVGDPDLGFISKEYAL